MRARMRVATEDSQQALVRTRGVVSALARANPGVEFEVIVIRERRSAPGGVFNHDDAGTDAATGLEAALLKGDADLAVCGAGCFRWGLGTTLAAVPARADARDAFVSRDGRGLEMLPEGSRVGAAGPLRRAQLLRIRPDLTPVPACGPADTELRRLATGDDGLAAVILEAARLARKGLLGHAADCLPVDRFLPAPGQGSVTVRARADDGAALDIISAIDDPGTRAACEAELGFLDALGTGPSAAVGAFACVCPAGGSRRQLDAPAPPAGRLRLVGAVFSGDGAEEVRGEASGPAHSAREIGASLAGRLMALGALVLLAREAVPA